jgi:flagellar hook protein FlgE
MFNAFSTALSALSADTTAIDVVGNNLANLNTTGFKGSVVSFRDLVTQSVGAGLGETQVGFGTDRPFTMRQFTQGAVQATGGVLDAAIQGDGFFVTRGTQNEQLFTRAGNFQVDGDGYLLTLTGDHVQGWTENAGGLVDTNLPIGDIFVPVGTLKPPIPTSTFSVDMNLNAAAVNGQPEGTFSTTMNVVDSLGNTHVLTITFDKTTNANEWDYAVTIPGADITGSTTPTVQLANGTLQFGSDGKMTSPDPTAPMVSVDIQNLSDNAAEMPLNWDLYTTAGVPRITQYSQISTPTANAQDGATAASLTKVGLADGGQIVAQYSNGTQRVVGQLAIASIRNPQSLIASGNNNFQASAKTALPAVGLPDAGGRGKVVGGSLEASTVDIAKEFTNLIVYQRGYQVNSRVVTTADDISQETVNLKR